MKKLILGFALGTIGVAVFSSASEIVISLSELAKAHMAVKISECNARINKLNEPEPTRTVAIGFATTDEKEDDYD